MEWGNTDEIIFMAFVQENVGAIFLKKKQLEIRKCWN